MRQLLRRALGAQSPKRSWEIPLDTRASRHAALDWAILAIQIGTRREAEIGLDPAASLKGDYLEFGVYEGNTFLHAHHRAREKMPWMRFFAFDSFAGLPALEGSDVDGEFRAGQFACAQERFEGLLGESDADMSRVRIVPGWYDDTLVAATRAEHELGICSIAFIDCDLYKSAVPVMAFLTDLVRAGSILLFDDWYNFRADPNKGVQRAAHAWLAANPHIALEKWHPFCHHGQAFIVQLR